MAKVTQQPKDTYTEHQVKRPLPPFSHSYSPLSTSGILGSQSKDGKCVGIKEQKRHYPLSLHRRSG